VAIPTVRTTSARSRTLTLARANWPPAYSRDSPARSSNGVESFAPTEPRQPSTGVVRAGFSSGGGDSGDGESITTADAELTHQKAVPLPYQDDLAS